MTAAPPLTDQQVPPRLFLASILLTVFSTLVMLKGLSMVPEGGLNDGLETHAVVLVVGLSFGGLFALCLSGSVLLVSLARLD